MANGDKDKVKSDKDKVKERKLNFKKESDAIAIKGRKRDADFTAKCKAFKKANPKAKSCKGMKFTNPLTPFETNVYNAIKAKTNSTVKLSPAAQKENKKRIVKDVNTPKKA